MVAFVNAKEHNKNMLSGESSLHRHHLPLAGLTMGPPLNAGSRSELAILQEGRWRPGLGEVKHNEVFANSGDGAGFGLALALAEDAGKVNALLGNRTDRDRGRKPVLWVQDRKSIRTSGRPYRHGLPRHWQDRLIHVEAGNCEDALFAMEEGLRCPQLAFVVGEIAGNPRGLSFTASRRLSLASERSGIALWLLRVDARPDLSSARMRWNARAQPSLRAEWDARAPGRPVWQAELFRSRSHAPGTWNLHAADGDLSIMVLQKQLTPMRNRLVGQAFIHSSSSVMRNAAQHNDAAVPLRAIA